MRSIDVLNERKKIDFEVHLNILKNLREVEPKLLQSQLTYLFNKSLRTIQNYFSEIRTQDALELKQKESKSQITFSKVPNLSLIDAKLLGKVPFLIDSHATINTNLGSGAEKIDYVPQPSRNHILINNLSHVPITYSPKPTDQAIRLHGHNLQPRLSPLVERDKLGRLS